MVKESPVRLLTMLGASLIVWASVFMFTYWGFTLLAGRSNIPGTGAIIGAIFDLAFFALGSMLLFSCGIIVYASLFTSPEARFLLTTPARDDQIFASKFQSAIGFSSWAFLILGSPILIAYGIVYAVPWYFYGVLPLFFLGFILLPGAAGSIGALLLVNFVPNRRKQAFIILILLVVAIGGIWAYRTIVLTRESFLHRDALQGLIDQFALTQSIFTPSHWVSRGLVASARGDVPTMVYYLSLLWSNALVGFLLACLLAKHLYRRGMNRVASSGYSRKFYRGSILDRLMAATVFYLDPQTRQLILKDFKTFRRDPAQWVQIVLFAGLIFLYLVNSRQFYLEDLGRGFTSSISLLNMIATSFLMCAYLVRFVYPMLSLEGRKFWILGLLPLKREKLLWGKYAFAFTGAMLIGSSMVTISDLILNIPWAGIFLHLFTVFLVAAGLSGLSVGIGAWMPNFKETDPSRIVVGFGGTMNTILGLCYLLFVILATAGPYHVFLAGESIRTGQGLPWWALAGLPIGIGLAIIAVTLPMRVGIRSLRHMEF